LIKEVNKSFDIFVLVRKRWSSNRYLFGLSEGEDQEVKPSMLDLIVSAKLSGSFYGLPKDM